MVQTYKKFYYELDEEDYEIAIMEDGGGCEHGQYYDTVCFWVHTEENAKDAVMLLNKLYEEGKNK